MSYKYLLLNGDDDTPIDEPPGGSRLLSDDTPIDEPPGGSRLLD